MKVYMFVLVAEAVPEFLQNHWEHSLGWDVLWPAGPIPYPICIFLQEPFYFFPPFQKVFFRLKQRAIIKPHTRLRWVESPAKQIFCSASKTIHETTLAAQISQLFAYHLISLVLNYLDPRLGHGGESVLTAGCKCKRSYPCLVFA